MMKIIMNHKNKDYSYSPLQERLRQEEEHHRKRNQKKKEEIKSDTSLVDLLGQS